MHSGTLMIMVKNFVLLVKNFVAGILSHKADLNVEYESTCITMCSLVIIRTH